jgi:methylation protein EvaC
MHCRVCDGQADVFVDFGEMPLANAFLTPDQFAGEQCYRLAAVRCRQCGMVQIADNPDPGDIFHDSYAYFSGTSRFMARHFEDYAREVMATLKLGPRSLVVEIGSNDGTMLRNFAAAGIRHLGVEPSANVAAVAKAQGIRTRCDFFSADVAKAIRAEEGPADAIVAANVIAHIPDFRSVAEGVRHLLADDGVFIFEAPDWANVVKMCSYDLFYDEHIFQFSATTVATAFARHGLTLVDVEPQWVHGGSLRFWLRHAAGARPSPRVAEFLDAETRQGLHLPATYDTFRARCEESRRQLFNLVSELRAEGKRVVGYGAAAKSAVVINYCNLTPEMIAFISDTTPGKQGKFSPGAHIPVLPHQDFAADYPDYAILFAWNHRDEVFAKEAAFREAGGRWILYVPHVHIL